MSNFPISLDSDADLPRVDDNITEIGADAINALRSAMFNVEAEIGIGASGTAGSIAQRLNNALSPDGTQILPSALAGVGLVTLPITDSEISPTAAIQESKLNLTYTTNSLFTLFTSLKSSIDVLNGFLSLTGVKLEPHIDGIAYNHELSAILVDSIVPMKKILQLPNVIGAGTSVVNRTTTNADLLVKDISDDLVIHEKADGSFGVTATTGGSVPPENYGHIAAGIYLDPSTFSTIPQTNNDVQKLAEFIDSSSLLLLGSRTQNLFANGVARTARSSALNADGYGEPLVPPTPVVAYLLNRPPGPIASSPVDNFNNGDDIVLFQPTAGQLSSFNFDAQFAQVLPGDLLTINYGVNNLTVQYVVDSKKSIIVGSVRTYAVRINGKNLFSSADGYGAFARIDRPQFHVGKYGVLAAARVPNQIGAYESLVIANPRSAAVLGIGFNSSEFDATHYNLYLSIFPTGDPTSLISLPAIDVTGNKGTTPGDYTLDSIVDATNTALRAPGFNYRFIAFEYQGNFGIMLADPYNNASFSIISGTVDTNGNYTSTSLSSFANGVIDNFNGIDPLGLGVGGANIASPPFSTSYSAVNAAANAPTLVFYPLKRNFYYTNGVETDRLRSDPVIIDQIADGYGDGYWPATILSPPATQVLPGRVEVVYQVNFDLSTSGLEVGKTIVVQPAFPITDARYNFRDYGRFIVKAISLNNCDTPSAFTNITVYDGVHGAGVSPAATSTNIPVRIYFSDDSVSFDAENVFDGTTITPFKRFFEVYVTQFGHTFTHERARFLESGTDISNINLYNVSPKLRGYPTNSDKEIRLSITSYNSTTGIFVGQLGRFISPSTFTNLGPLTTGKKGDIVRFYDETNIDYIDFIFNQNTSLSSFASRTIDIQLFPTLELDEELMLLATCQVEDTTKKIAYLKDARQFGNTSEEQLTNSALDYIAAPTKLLNDNGIIRGFDLTSVSGNTVAVDGGTAVVNGKIIQINPTNLEIPAVVEAVGYTTGSPVTIGTSTVNVITWFLCVNDNHELELIASTDFDPNGAFVSTYNTASVDNTRLFFVANPNIASPVAYQVRGTYLGDLVVNQRDLTPIAILSSTVTSSGGTYSVSTLTGTDARRFIYNGYGGLSTPFTLGPNAAFRNITSLVAWLTQLNNLVSATNTSTIILSNRVKVKGEITIANPVMLSFNNNVIFEGDGGVFTISSAQGFVLGNNVTFDGVRFDYTNVPVNGVGGYLTANLVNSFNAALYGSVTTSSSNIVIKNCVFRSFNTNRYSFISFEFPTVPAVLQNVIIRDNQFVSLSGSQDLRAAIAFNSISNTSPGSIDGGIFPAFPKLVNCTIENNICNNDQMFIITCPRTAGGTGQAVGGPLLTCNNVKIVGNICGTIGFITSYDIPSALDNSSFNGLVRDKMDNLYIGNNTCKYIANLDGAGKYLAFQSILYPTNTTITVMQATGNFEIVNNACTWIHVGSVTEALGLTTNSGTISRNQLYPYQSSPAAYLANFTDTTNSITPPNAAIVLRQDGYDGSLWSYTIISENTINQRMVNSGSDTFVAYDHGILCFNSAEIINNTIGNNCLTSSTSTYMIFVYGATSGPITGPTITVRGNILNRAGAFGANTIAAYIGTNTSSATNRVVITDNVFDLITTNSVGPVYNDQNTNIPNSWTYTQNVNQVSYAAFPLYEHLNFGPQGGSFTQPPMSPGLSAYGMATDIVFNGSSSALIVGQNIKLTGILPYGVQILYVTFGVFNSTSGFGGHIVTNAGSFISMAINENMSNQINPPSSLGGSIVDVAVHSNTGGTVYSPGTASIDLSNAGVVANLLAGTVYLNMDMSGASTQLYTGREYEVILSLFFSDVKTVGTTDLYISPIVIRYAWT